MKSKYIVDLACSALENKLLILLSELIHSNHNQLFKCWKWAFFNKEISYKIQKDSQLQNSVKTQSTSTLILSQQIFCMLWYGGRPPHGRWCGVTLTGSDVNICADFVGRFSACYKWQAMQKIFRFMFLSDLDI